MARLRALVGATGLAASLLIVVTAPVVAAPISSITGTLDNLASGQPLAGACVYGFPLTRRPRRSRSRPSRARCRRPQRVMGATK